MMVREFLRANMRSIEGAYLEHEGSGVDGSGIVVCRCGYRSLEDEWLRHVADKIADELLGPTELTLECL